MNDRLYWSRVVYYLMWFAFELRWNSDERADRRLKHFEEWITRNND